MYKSGSPWTNAFGLKDLNCKGLGVQININPSSPTIVTGLGLGVAFEYKNVEVQGQGIIDFARPDQLCVGVTFSKITLQNVLSLVRNFIPGISLPPAWDMPLGESISVLFATPGVSEKIMGFTCTPGVQARFKDIPMFMSSKFSGDVKITFEPPALEVRELKAVVNVDMYARITKNIAEIVNGTLSCRSSLRIER